MHFFSIIIPSLNQGHFIEQTINSILTQSYPYKEIIVCDGGSDDHTIEILKSYGTKIQWISEKDRGQAHAINKGLKLAKGDILTYLNADDMYCSHCLNIVNEFWLKHPDLMWVTGDYYIIDGVNCNIQKPISLYKNILRFFPTKSMLSIVNFIAQPSTFWTQKALDQIGYFDESLCYTMDYDYWFRLIQKYPLGIIHQKLSYFRIHHQSKSVQSFQAQFAEELSIAQKYDSNSFRIYLHQLHNRIIVAIYNIIK